MNLKISHLLFRHFFIKRERTLSLLYLVIAFVFACSFLNASSVKKYEIKPLNRLSINFDSLPSKITSSLSDDKKTLTITLGKVTWTNDKAFITSEGIIKRAELRSINETTHLTLTLIAPRGYTIAKLPYTQSLVIDVFDWKKLDSAEDAFRMGLLSLIDGEDSLAKPDIMRAIKGGVADAATFGGLIFLNKGEINSAIKCFRLADARGVELPDVYAALAQLYAVQKDTTLAKYFSDKYLQKTGESFVPTMILPILHQVPADSDLGFADKIIDSAMPKVDTTIKDTLRAGQDTLNQDTLGQEDSIWAAEGYLLVKYVVGIVLALALFITYLYLKWRNKQLLARQQQNAMQTKSQNKQTKTQPSKFDAVMTDNIKTARQVSKHILPSQSSQSIIQESDFKKNADDLLKFAGTMKQNDALKSSSILAAEAEFQTESEIKSANYQAGSAAYNAVKNHPYNTKKPSATLELATRLAAEQSKIKSEKLANLNNVVIGEDTAKLGDIAQKLGIETNSVETKQNIDAISGNADEFAKLTQKFGVKQNNGDAKSN